MPDNRRIVLVGGNYANGDTLSILDTTSGLRRTIYASPEPILSPSVSPDGKRIAYGTGRVEWNLLEIGVPSGTVRTMLVGGGVSWYPAWHPSGTHYLYATNRSGRWTLEDASTSDGFSRRLSEMDSTDNLQDPRWAPDGSRFIFGWRSPDGTLKVMLSNASGGLASPLDPSAPGPTGPATWSPDGQWVLYARTMLKPRGLQMARIRPGSTSPPDILASYDVEDPAGAERARAPVYWSPDGKWLLTVGQGGPYLVSADLKNERRLSSRPAQAGGFSKDGREVFVVIRNTSGQGAEWQLVSIDVATGAERKLADVDFPATTDGVQGFSLHPDGTRFATSIAKWPFDIWMLEGFDPQ